jgi:hypothetical protein
MSKQTVDPRTVPSFTVSGQWIQDMRRPMVYVWRRGEQVLYVGLARTGMVRPLGPHHRLTRKGVQPDDVLELFVCQTGTEAIALEQAMIGALKPAMNQKFGIPVDFDDPTVHQALRARINELEFENSQRFGLLCDIADGNEPDPIEAARQATGYYPVKERREAEAAEAEAAVTALLEGV